jgi:UPF0755 protein
MNETLSPGAPSPGMRRRRFIVFGTLGLVVLLVAGSCTAWFRLQVDPPGGPREELLVEVPEGSSGKRIAEILDEKGVVSNANLFQKYLARLGENSFQAGTYRLRRASSFEETLAALKRGPEVSFERLTIPEGLILAQVAERVAQIPGRSAQRFLEVAGSGQVRSRYQPEGSVNLEGLLLPETYNVDDDSDERAMLERMVGAFDDVAGRVGLDQVTQGGLVTPYQAVTVASLVEREARVPEDRGMIARVIYNRLRQRMALQVDATVIYALGRTGQKDLRVLNKDLEVDSPYNTYRIAGLPPTPIASPGRAALEAAVDPPPGPWLYYVVVESSGKHAFATTLEEHNRNIALAKSRGLR